VTAFFASALGAIACSAQVVSPLFGCPFCFGDPSSDMVKGAKAGVLFLLAVVAGLLVAIALIARSWAKRARALEHAGHRANDGGGAAQPGANSPGTISPALPSLTSSNA
jgi:hypothetical protein